MNDSRDLVVIYAFYCSVDVSVVENCAAAAASNIGFIGIIWDGVWLESIAWSRHQADVRSQAALPI
jgi:hypothetical protein